MHGVFNGSSVTINQTLVCSSFIMRVGLLNRDCRMSIGLSLSSLNSEQRVQLSARQHNTRIMFFTLIFHMMNLRVFKASSLLRLLPEMIDKLVIRNVQP